MKIPKYATVPLDAKVDSVSLTPGRTYKIRKMDNYTATFGHGFWIISDTGSHVYGLERSCGHLDNGNWILSETEKQRRNDDISTNKLRAVSVLLFVFIVCMCLFGL